MTPAVKTPDAERRVATYQLRVVRGTPHVLDAIAFVNDAQRAAVERGDAELVRVDAGGVDDIVWCGAPASERLLQRTDTQERDIIVGYAVKLVTGAIRPVSEHRALTPEQVEGLIGGGAELVGVDARGVMTPVVASLDPSRLTPRSPLLCIRVRRSGSPAFYRGQIFDTMADFDAKVRAVRGAEAAEWEHEVDIVIEWKDGASFHARFNLFRDHGEYLHDHIQRVCGEVLRDPMFAPFAPAARLTIVRMFVTAVAETSARLEDS